MLKVSGAPSGFEPVSAMSSGEVPVVTTLCAFAVGVAASVVRQVFAVSLYRTATAGGTA